MQKKVTYIDGECEYTESEVVEISSANSFADDNWACITVALKDLPEDIQAKYRKELEKAEEKNTITVEGLEVNTVN